MVQSSNQIENEIPEKKEDHSTDGMRSRLTSLVASVLPLAQSIPPLTIWGGLMTIPLLSYLVLLFTSGPVSFGEAILQLFFGGFVWEQILAVLGLATLVYSIVHMRIAKAEGLVDSGPYRYIRHPQYLGVVLFTLTLTTRSYWIGTNTFGMSWIDPKMTIVIWYGTLFAYIVLAFIEELHLSKKFGSDYGAYKQKTGMLLPFVKHRSRALEVLATTLILTLVLVTIVVLLGSHPLIPPSSPWPGTDSSVVPPNWP